MQSSSCSNVVLDIVLLLCFAGLQLEVARLLDSVQQLREEKNPKQDCSWRLLDSL